MFFLPPPVSFAIQQGVFVPSDCLAARSPFPWGHKALPDDYLHWWPLKTHLLLFWSKGHFLGHPWRPPILFRLPWFWDRPRRLEAILWQQQTNALGGCQTHLNILIKESVVFSETRGSSRSRWTKSVKFSFYTVNKFIYATTSLSGTKSMKESWIEGRTRHAAVGFHLSFPKDTSRVCIHSRMYSAHLFFLKNEIPLRTNKRPTLVLPLPQNSFWNVLKFEITC